MGQIFLNDDEYAAIERLLAGLMLTATDHEEEIMILAIHSRVASIYEKGAALRRARERLSAINDYGGADG